MWATGVIAYELLTKTLPFTPNVQLVQFCKEYSGSGGDQLPLDALVQSGVGDLAVDFITTLLKLDSVGRLTVEEALEHGWCQVDTRPRDSQILTTEFNIRCSI